MEVGGISIFSLPLSLFSRRFVFFPAVGTDELRRREEPAIGRLERPICAEDDVGLGQSGSVVPVSVVSVIGHYGERSGPDVPADLALPLEHGEEGVDRLDRVDRVNGVDGRWREEETRRR